MGGRVWARVSTGWRWCIPVGGLLIAAALLSAPATAAGGFEDPASHDTSQQTGATNVQRQDTPSDPDYDRAEPDSPRYDPNAQVTSQRYDLFGFAPAGSPLAIYKDGPLAGKPMISGFNAAGAWKRERGRSDVIVAILDTGIRWENKGLRTQVHLNTPELPLPQRVASTTAASYDANGDGVVNVDDYAADPRVKKAQPTGEDLINTFGHCQVKNGRPVGSTCAGTAAFDNDNNGFENDIAGWDFFNDTNNPVDRSSYFAARNHGTGRAEEAVERGNDGEGSIGVCPKCQFIPIRTFDTFVSDGNTFGLGIVYGTRMGASVIEGANGSLTHTAFSEAASQYAYDQGAAQTYSGNDLNTGDHNYPANYNHTMEIQGTTPDGGGAADDVLASIPAELKAALGLPSADPTVLTYFRGANTTQFGGHSSISMEGSTGSQNTGKAAGAAALVISAAKNGPKHLTLTPDETRELLEQTAEVVTQANGVGIGNPDPGVIDPVNDSHFTTHFGWGRANVGAAVQHAWDGDLPAVASITSPDWYAPLTGEKVRIRGRAAAPTSAPSGASFSWKLRVGAGLAPAQLREVRSGSATSPVTDFGTLDLGDIRQLLDSTNIPPDLAGPTFSPTAMDPFEGQFTVELDVQYGGSSLLGVDRKVLTLLPDGQQLTPGFPMRLGTGGEAPPRYADLNGDGVQELLVPGQDGKLRALEPDGSELAGWPFVTPIQASAARHQSALKDLPPVRDSLRGTAIADLDGDGTQELVVAAGTRIYALQADGSVRPGFPVSVDPKKCIGTQQTQPNKHRKCGFASSPALGHLVKGSNSLQVVATALDGNVYVWDSAGKLLPHYPVDLSDTTIPVADRQLSESITNPTLRDLNKDGVDDIIAASNEAYSARGPSPDDVNGGLSEAFAAALSQIGGSSRLYAINGASGAFLPGWPVKLNGAIQDVLPFIGPGHDSATLTLAGEPVVVTSTTGGVVSEYSADGTLLRGIQQSAFGTLSNATDRTGVFNLFEYATIGDVLGAGNPAIVKYGLTLGQVANLALSGQNVPYNHLIGAYDASSGLPLPAWPTVTDDYQFLSTSTIAQVVGGASQQVLAGTGLGLLHAYDGLTGGDVAGFPKVTGGGLFAPPALSDDHRLATISREGYLFQWALDGFGPTCQSEWPTYRHDPHNSGDYNTDGTAPGAPLKVALVGTTLSFGSPGDDYYCSAPASYVVLVNGKPVPFTGDVQIGRQPATIELASKPPAGSRVSVMARDDAGNTGIASSVILPGLKPPIVAPPIKKPPTDVGVGLPATGLLTWPALLGLALIGLRLLHQRHTGRQV